MIRVVLDTNIIVSAMLRSGSLPEAVFNLAINRVAALCYSKPILDEYQEVLRRPRLKIQLQRVEVALSHIRDTGLLVVPLSTITAASDPDDNIFLECADAANADYLVTGNQADFPEKWGNCHVLSAREFLEVVTQIEPV